MTKREQRELSEYLNTGLVLYVPTENRAAFAEFLAERIIPRSDHERFIRACLKD